MHGRQVVLVVGVLPVAGAVACLGFYCDRSSIIYHCQVLVVLVVRLPRGRVLLGRLCEGSGLVV